MKEKYYVAYLKGREDKWKFLCKKNKGEYIVIHNFNGDNEEFKGVRVTNEDYIIREATQKDIDDIILEEL